MALIGTVAYCCVIHHVCLSQSTHSRKGYVYIWDLGSYLAQDGGGVGLGLGECLRVLEGWGGWEFCSTPKKKKKQVNDACHCRQVQKTCQSFTI